ERGHRSQCPVWIERPFHGPVAGAEAERPPVEGGPGHHDQSPQDETGDDRPGPARSGRRQVLGPPEEPGEDAGADATGQTDGRRPEEIGKVEWGLAADRDEWVGAVDGG